MKIDRLIGVITYLLQHKKATAIQLAERFEVSRRTILRDIDALCNAGIPIATVRGGDGGISIMEGYKLDKSVLTKNELDSIITGLKGLSSVSKAQNIEQLIQKLLPTSSTIVSPHEHIVIDLSSYYKDSLSPKIEQIKFAIAEQRCIEFDYYSRNGVERRKIEPCFIQFKWSDWYAFGWCCLRRDFRLFKLNRLWNLKVLDEHFIPHTVPLDAVNREVCYLEPPQNVKLMFDKSVRFRLIEEYGLNCYTEMENGLHLDLEYTNRSYIKSWILGFGDTVSVLEPQDFRDEIKEIAKNILERYK